MSDDLTCKECNSTFKTKQTLRQHMVYKHSGKIWKCDICKKTFNQSGTLATHKLLHTGFTIQCDVCDSKFRNTYDLKVHKSRYHYGNLEKKNVCSTCNKSFFKKSKLNEHLVIHTGEKPYKCNACDKGFSLRDNMRKHEKTYCAKLGKSLEIGCDLCSSMFKTTSHLKRHKNLKHNAAPKKFKCNLCDHETIYQGNLKKHEQLAHKDEYTKVKCEKCSKLISLRNLKTHQIAHCRFSTQDKNFVCQKCPASFNADKKLKQHIRVVHGPIMQSVECKICGSVFKSQDRLRVHKKNIHSGNPPKKCETCNKDIRGSENAFRNHILTHSNRRESCNVCQKSLANKKELDLHILRAHQGAPKIFQCNLCEKRFLTKFELDSHNIVHTGLKDFKCDHCQKMFGSNSNMRKHQKTNCISSQKDLVFQCKICPKAFNAEVKLKAHQVAHVSSLNFECKTCQKKWKHKKSLDYHNRKSHPQST